MPGVLQECRRGAGDWESRRQSFEKISLVDTWNRPRADCVVTAIKHFSQNQESNGIGCLFLTVLENLGKEMEELRAFNAQLNIYIRDLKAFSAVLKDMLSSSGAQDSIGKTNGSLILQVAELKANEYPTSSQGSLVKVRALTEKDLDPGDWDGDTLGCGDGNLLEGDDFKALPILRTYCTTRFASKHTNRFKLQVAPRVYCDPLVSGIHTKGMLWFCQTILTETHV